ncbi:hypothetical protein RGR602_CH01237 [Rhizobium gallicum bv. gallicum R602sp]|uniref:Uncharacterized protein n=1 Tax=Rhizobium gallicum bv. gallicum R602sp TaxID=1041138 RepID=A0A0B4X1H4_9HYPH|nr:hypothetical protein RGR602_CH01237 [Rhizobium gallicum bv. gallicum R602sp]
MKKPTSFIRRAVPRVVASQSVPLKMVGPSSFSSAACTVTDVTARRPRANIAMRVCA